MSRTKLGLIWAEASGGVIGKGGTMPWHLPEDLAHFKRTTLGSPVIMGRRTWESLPDRARPLPGRQNIVVTRNTDYVAPGAIVVTSVHEGLAAADAAIAETTDGGTTEPIIWNIGGAELFSASIEAATELALTRIALEVAGADTFAPELSDDWQLVSRGETQLSKTGLEFTIERWRRES